MRIIRLVDNVSMGLGHQGLHRLMLGNFKLDITKLEDGQLVMFLNKKKDKLKIIGKSGTVLGYLKMPNGRRIMLDAVQYIPQTFGGSGFDYDLALKKALRARLVKPTELNKFGPLQVFRAMKGSGLINSRKNLTETKGVNNG